ncbi:hypothetical protein RB595_003650 [Gaeumannomyces hyphopodioides]
MARATGCRLGDGAARSRPCPVTSRSAFPLAIAVAACGAGVGAVAVSGRDGSSAASTITLSSPAGQAFAPEDVVTVKYTSPLAWPVLSTWCDPASPRQESIQRAHPFSGQLTVPLSRIRLDGGDESEEKECWFNLGPLADPDQSGTNSERFIVTRRRGRRKTGDVDDDDDDDDEKRLELRDDGTPRGTRTVGPRDQHKRATPDIPAPTAQQTSGPSDAFINCPSDNLTVYTEPVTAKRYVVLCGRDYSSDFGAYDIRSLPSPNTNECIARCASDKTGCTAVGWGDYRGNFTCFMKRSIGEPNNAPAWRVAVEDPSQRGTGATPRPELANTATPAAQNTGGAGGLSGDAKAGIGVGVALGVIMIVAGAVAIWYFEQRRQLRQRARETEERKLEAASGSTDGGSNGSSSSSPRVGPPTRGSSYRSDRQQQAAAVAAAAGMAATPPNARGSGSSDAAAGTRDPQAAGSIRSTGSGGARGAPASEGTEGTDATTPTGLTHVSSYLRQQQQFILDSCKQQGGGSESTTTTTPPQKPERAWTGVSDSTPSGHESVVSPWSATGPGPTSAASELPVREGYQGYGPEYEMPSGAEPGGRAPRPHHPGPLWGAEAAEQKFLLSDMAAMKMRVAPDDRTELP